MRGIFIPTDSSDPGLEAISQARLPHGLPLSPFYGLPAILWFFSMAQYFSFLDGHRSVHPRPSTLADRYYQIWANVRGSLPNRTWRAIPVYLLIFPLTFGSGPRKGAFSPSSLCPLHRADYPIWGGP